MNNYFSVLNKWLPAPLKCYELEDLIICLIIVLNSDHYLHL